MLAWLVLTTLGAWLLKREWQSRWIVVCTALFLLRYSPVSLLVLSLLTGMAGFAVITSRGRHSVLLCAIVSCVVIFVCYRFYSQHEVNQEPVIVLGLAFYLLRIIHLLLESYKGNIARSNWLELTSWLWFLPTMQVGPIHRFGPYVRDLTRRRWDLEIFLQGLKRIIFGYAKLVILGTYLVDNLMLNWVATLPQDSWTYHYLSLCRYGMSLYFQFAGYSDIAIGFALLLGFRVIENFNFPFLARDISDFWRRWHISLSSWCREYVYMPAISVTRSPFLAAVASMLVLGIWHELSWRYLLWGAWHGVGIAGCHFWQKTSFRNAILTSPVSGWWSVFSWLLTLHFVIASFALTSAASLSETLAHFKVLIGVG
ncbi:MAG: hypothetical protein EP324_02975 [Gammaproteobacteria bacterium]|nr:MAG: hypothetical protein EP324_02975 [Gammaproteobacteria bacterium]